MEVGKGNKRAEAKARTRQKALAAAKDLFTHLSYSDVTMRGIAAKMEMSTGAVFANFKGKHDIFSAVVVEELEAQEEIAQAAIREGGSLGEMLDRLFMRIYEREESQTSFLCARFRVMWTLLADKEPEAARARKKINDADLKLMGVVCRALDRAAKHGEILSDHDYCSLLWDLHNGNLRRLAEGYDLEHLKENLHEQLDIIVKY